MAFVISAVSTSRMVAGLTGMMHFLPMVRKCCCRAILAETVKVLQKVIVVLEKACSIVVCLVVIVGGGRPADKASGLPPF